MGVSENGLIGLFAIFVVLHAPTIYTLYTRDDPLLPPKKFYIIDEFFNTSIQNKLLHIFRDVTYSTTANDQISKYQHIGEEMPLNSDGSCPHPYLVPDNNHSICQFPASINIVRHQFLSGGYEGDKSLFTVMATRMLIYEAYYFDAISDTSHPYHDMFQFLFNQKEFTDASHSICGKERPIIQPYELLLAIQMPGQTAPLHLDSPFFHGANSFLYPRWLLVVMQESGLFETKQIPQIQSVIYVHNWIWNSTDGGEFLWFHKGIDYDPIVIPPISKTVVLVDGTTTVHSTNIFKPEDEMTVLDKDANITLRYNQQTKLWDLYENSVLKRSFYDNELRLAIINRARCYKSIKDRDEHNKVMKQETDLSIKKILTMLIKDSQSNGKLKQRTLNEWLQKENILELSLTLLDKYIKLPWPISHSWIPFNYCILPKLGPSWEWMENILRYICN